MALGRIAAFVLATLLTVYGAWLLLRPDYDDGRHTFGAIVLAVAVPIFAVSGIGLLRLFFGRR